MSNDTPKHLHREAFCLMWYGCDCRHLERIWNSRDGVTPFCMQCPSCGQPNLRHVMWTLDEYAPNHQPPDGQRMWVDMTRDEAKRIAHARIQIRWRNTPAAPGALICAPDFEALVADIYRDGKAPMLAVAGYVRADGKPAGSAT